MTFSTSFHWGCHADHAWREPARVVDVCRRAMAAGFASVELPVTRSVADALSLAAAAAAAIGEVRFKLRLTCPTSALLDTALADEGLTDACTSLAGRLILHVRMDDHDSSQDGGIAEAGAVLESWRQLFTDSARPEVDVEGQASEAAFLAIRHADRLWRQPARPTVVDGDAWPVLHFGKQVGLVASLVARETRSEALDAAAALLPHGADLASDSASWTTPLVWAGDAPDARAAVLIGSFDELAHAIGRYERGGISSVLIRGWGVDDVDDREMAIFSSRLLPLVRRGE